MLQRLLSALITAVMLVSGLLYPVDKAEAASPVGTTYYISNEGDDKNKGTSEGKPWKTLEKVNSVTFKPGDKLLFKSGHEWVGQLAPKGSGSKGKPILIGKYGGDSRPLIQGNGTVEGDDIAPDPKKYNAALQFYNQQYWEITNLEITNYSEKKSTWKTYNSSSQIITQTDKIPSKYGILIIAKDNGMTRHMQIKDCDIHDVNGDTLINRGAGIGRGAIVYMIRGNKVETWWDDILVEGCNIGRPDDGRKDPEGNHAANITSYGISFVSTWCGTIFPHESGIPGTEVAASKKYSTNLVFRNNYFVDIGNAAICPSGYENAVLENNVSDHCNSGVNGNVPFWWQLGTNTVAQYNEVFGTGAAAAKEDSQAFDADLAASENYIQYNYTHDNPSGSYFECAVGTVFNTHYRYNISQNDGDGFNSHGKGAVIAIGGGSTNAASKLYVYNNDMIVGENHIGLMANAWETIGEGKKANYVFENNLMYSDGESGKPIGGKPGGTKVKGWEDRFYEGSTLDNNYYGGTDLAAIDRGSTTNSNNTNPDLHPVYGDISEEIPKLKEAYRKNINDAAGWKNTEAYKRAEVNDPVLKGSGKLLPYNGGLDFFGNPLSPFDKPSIGVHETQGGLTVPDGTKYVNFDSAAPGKITSSDAGGIKFSKAWKVNEKEEVYVKTSEYNSNGNKIVIPAGYALYGFSAKTAGGSAALTLEDGKESRKFYLTSSKNSYLTAYEGKGSLSKSKDLYLSISCPKGADQVSIDNLILVPVSESPQNVALNKPATHSGGYNTADKGNDGNPATMAGNTGKFPYIWTVNLGDAYEITRTEIEWEDLYSGEKKGDPSTWGSNIPEDWKYKIEYSQDNGSSWQMLLDYTGTNPNTDEATSVIQGSDTKVTANQFRVTITGKPSQKPDAWAVLPEFRAFGKKYYENVALNKYTGQNMGSDGKKADYVVDGDPNTMGGGRGSDYLPYEWYVDLGDTYHIYGTELIWEAAIGDADWKYAVEYALEKEDQNDKSLDWKVLADYTGGNPHKETVQTENAPPGTSARYLRIRVTGKASGNPSLCHIAEFKAFGELVKEKQENVALGKTASQTGGTNAPGNAVDDDINTYAGNVSGTTPYSWMVDLGSDINIAAVETFYEDVAEKAEDVKYKIWYADSSVTPTVNNNTGWTQYVDFSSATPYAGNPATSRVQTIRIPVTARYFKFDFISVPTDTTWWKVMREFRALKEVGNTAEEEFDMYNLAYGKPVKSSVNQESAENLADGKTDTSWTAEAAGDWARIDLGLHYDMKDVKVAFKNAPRQFKMFVSADGESYTEAWAFDDGGNTEKQLEKEITDKGIRYLKFETGDESAEILDVTAHGKEVATAGKTIMVMAPHPDDEVIMSGGVIQREIQNGNQVYVYLGTNGDYNGTAAAGNRMKESIAALQNLGVPLNHILFSGYGDRGGLWQFNQPFTDGMIYKLYTAEDENAIVAGRHTSATYGGVVDSWHKRLTGSEGEYSRRNYLTDMQSAINLYRPDEIYCNTRFDLHSDHAAMGMFVGEAVINVRREDESYKPRVYEATVHSIAGDSGNGGKGNWPALNDDSKGIEAHKKPANQEFTADAWEDRVSFTVPESMRVTPFSYNLKDQTLRKYISQYYNYIAAFAKFDEFFWERDYNAISYFASIEASSENTAEGAGAAKAIDGIRDGYSTSLAQMYPNGALSGTPLTNHNRFPFGEWVADGAAGESLTLNWDQVYDISKLVLYDRPDIAQNITGATVTFKYGDKIVGTKTITDPLPEDGKPYTVDLSGVTTTGVTSVTIVITDVSAGTTNAGLAEVEAYGQPGKGVPEAGQFTYETVEGDSTKFVSSVYTGNADPVSVTPNSGVGDVTVYYNGEITAPKNAGIYDITIDAAEGISYQAVSGLYLGTYEILPAPLTITANSVNHTTNSPLPELHYTVTGIVEGETKEDALAEEPDITTETDGTEPGSFAVTVSGGTTTNNYTIASRVDGILLVSDAALTGDLLIDKTNPQIDDVLTAAFTGTNNTGELSFSWTINGEQVGTGETYTVREEDVDKIIMVSVTSNVEDGMIQSSPTEAVARLPFVKELLIYETADGKLKSVIYNGSQQPFLIRTKEESGAGNITAIYYNDKTTVPKNAGEYTVTADVSVGGRYAKADKVEIGTYIINKAPLTLNALGITITVGETLPAFTYTVSGIAVGETQKDAISAEPKLSSDGDGKKAGTYKIEIKGGKAADNYEIVERVSGSLQVIPKTQITGTIKIKPNQPKIGDTLTAELTNTNSKGILTYIWKVNGVYAGEGETYTVMEDDADKEITVTVISSDCSGEITSKSVVAKPDKKPTEPPKEEEPEVPPMDPPKEEEPEVPPTDLEDNSKGSGKAPVKGQKPPASSKTKTPPTGDTAEPIIWIVLIVFSLSGSYVAWKKLKK